MIDPTIRDRFASYSTPLEGCVPHLYCDTKGLVTVAIGCLVDSPGAAAALTGWDNPGAVEADWHRVKAMPPGLVWTRYAALSSPRLSADGIAAVVADRLDADVAVLERRWPHLSSWPAPAQAAILSLAWAVGPGTTGSGVSGPTWPHLGALLDAEEAAAHRGAADAEDWLAAAVAGQLAWASNAGVRPRDFTIAALFRLADGQTLAEACAGWPAGSSADAARKALAAFPFCQDPAVSP